MMQPTKTKPPSSDEALWPAAEARKVLETDATQEVRC